MKKILKSISLALVFIMGITLLSACSLFPPAPGSGPKIEINTAFKTDYILNETLDVTGGILDYTVDGNTTQVLITLDMVEGFSSAIVGTRNMIIRHEGCTMIVSYTVSDYPYFKAGILYLEDSDEDQISYVYMLENGKIGMAGTDKNLDLDELKSRYQNGEYLFNPTKELISGKYEATATVTAGGDVQTYIFKDFTATGFTLKATSSIVGIEDLVMNFVATDINLAE